MDYEAVWERYDNELKAHVNEQQWITTISTVEALLKHKFHDCLSGLMLACSLWVGKVGFVL